MDAPEIIAGVAALAAAGTGAGTYILGAKRLTHERVLADRDDARLVLAAAAHVLWTMRQAMQTQAGPLYEALNSMQIPPDFEIRIASLEAARDLMERELDILKIRFPLEAEVVISYNGSLRMARWLITHYQTNVGGAERMSAVREAVAVTKDFDTSREKFLTAAQRAVGTSL